MKLILASHNKHKTQEIREIIGSVAEITDLYELEFSEDIAETGKSFEENAFIKANTIFQKYKTPVLADDSGLCVDGLGGEPGIYSARFAGENATASVNNTKLLEKLKGVVDRTAFFICVLCYIDQQGNAQYFEGKVMGKIIDTPNGNEGFGYDPLFVPDGYSKTFAEMGEEIKNTISHRNLALQKLRNHLQK